MHELIDAHLAAVLHENGACWQNQRNWIIYSNNNLGAVHHQNVLLMNSQTKENNKHPTLTREDEQLIMTQKIWVNVASATLENIFYKLLLE